MPDDAELLRLRNRFHDLEKQVWAAAGVDAELARKLTDLRDRVDTLTRRVDGVTKADEIAHAVTTAIRADRRRRFTIPRRLAGAGVALILLVPALHDLTGWIGTG